MKRDLAAPILQIDGTEFPGKSKHTLQTVCFTALTVPHDDDARLPTEEKIKLYKLAQRISQGGDVEFTSEELALLKARIAKVFVHVVVIGRAFDLLDADAKSTEVLHHPV